MSVFTPAEIAYLQSQPLGRLATVGPDEQPHVVPMGFRVNTDLGTIDIGGLRVSQTKKWRDLARNPRIAFVVDDIASRDPWRVRMLEIRGQAELLDAGGKEIMPRFEDALIRIHPRRIVAFGIEGEDAPFNARSVS
ncbi:MAG TPA: PPOX class F420-dependent oxidoreductase [Thermomicrobiales bacterium]|jgi:pyridoxamine 5'-phosphate oxidase family protein